MSAWCFQYDVGRISVWCRHDVSMVSAWCQYVGMSTWCRHDVNMVSACQYDVGMSVWSQHAVGVLSVAWMRDLFLAKVWPARTHFAVTLGSCWLWFGQGWLHRLCWLSSRSHNEEGKVGRSRGINCFNFVSLFPVRRFPSYRLSVQRQKTNVIPKHRH